MPLPIENPVIIIINTYKPQRNFNEVHEQSAAASNGVVRSGKDQAGATVLCSANDKRSFRPSRTDTGNKIINLRITSATEADKQTD